MSFRCPTYKEVSPVTKVILWVALSVTCTNLCFPDVIPVPPTEQSIQGSWVGLPSESSDFCRLVLTNGRGQFAFSIELGKSMVYTVNSYSLDRQGGITLKTSAASTNAYPVVVTGKAKHSQIRIMVRAPDGGWWHESVLYREEGVESRLQDLRSSMKQLEKR